MPLCGHAQKTESQRNRCPPRFNEYKDTAAAVFPFFVDLFAWICKCRICWPCLDNKGWVTSKTVLHITGPDSFADCWIHNILL
eukprot:2449251-Amphidinium_carterae.2